MPFLLDSLSDVTVNPAVWGRGTFPAHALTVKHSTQRQLLLAAHADVKLKLKPGHALQPLIWSRDPADPAAGIRALEERWLGGCSAGPAGESSPVLPAYFFPSKPRAPPRARGPPPERALPVTRAPPGVHDDEIDPAESHPDPFPSLSRIWQELHQPDIHRQARITAWRVLHGSLMVGAFQNHVFKRTAALACPHASCNGCAATLTHTFLECTAVAPVVAYICAFWKIIDPAAQPLLPFTLLTADARHWVPSPHLQSLWVRLRLYFLQAVWAAVQRAAAQTGQPRVASSGAIISSMLHSCRLNMRQDWLLATSGFRDPHADRPTDQLRGLTPKLSKERFFIKWGGAGVLCRTNDTQKLTILWTTRTPVLAFNHS